MTNPMTPAATITSLIAEDHFTQAMDVHEQHLKASAQAGSRIAALDLWWCATSGSGWVTRPQRWTSWPRCRRTFPPDVPGSSRGRARKQQRRRGQPTARQALTTN